jgi:hypothetical protein
VVRFVLRCNLLITSGLACHRSMIGAVPVNVILEWLVIARP